MTATPADPQADRAARLDAISARAERARPGPWRWLQQEYNERMARHKKPRRKHDLMLFLLRGPDPYDNPDQPLDPHENTVLLRRWDTVRGTTAVAGDFPRDEDADFIAHSRADVPWLVGEVRALEALAVDCYANLIFVAGEPGRAVEDWDSADDLTKQRYRREARAWVAARSTAPDLDEPQPSS